MASHKHNQTDVPTEPADSPFRSSIPRKRYSSFDAPVHRKRSKPGLKPSPQKSQKSTSNKNKKHKKRKNKHPSSPKTHANQTQQHVTHHSHTKPKTTPPPSPTTNPSTPSPQATPAPSPPPQAHSTPAPEELAHLHPNPVLATAKSEARRLQHYSLLPDFPPPPPTQHQHTHTHLQARADAALEALWQQIKHRALTRLDALGLAPTDLHAALALRESLPPRIYEVARKKVSACAEATELNVLLTAARAAIVALTYRKSVDDLVRAAGRLGGGGSGEEGLEGRKVDGGKFREMPLETVELLRVAEERQVEVMRLRVLVERLEKEKKKRELGS